MPLQAFIVNTELPKLRLSRKWADLIDDKYEGEIILANPALSGSACADLWENLQTVWLGLPGELARKAVFTASSTMVCASVARGEYAIGVTGEANVASHIEQGDPVIPYISEEGTEPDSMRQVSLKGRPICKCPVVHGLLTSEEAYRILETRSTRCCSS